MLSLEPGFYAAKKGRNMQLHMQAKPPKYAKICRKTPKYADFLKNMQPFFDKIITNLVRFMIFFYVFFNTNKQKEQINKTKC